MTVLEHYYWFTLKLKEDRTTFKKKVMFKTGISETTFYRLLRFEPGKLIKEKISELTSISPDQLYQEKEITELTPNKI